MRNRQWRCPVIASAALAALLLIPARSLAHSDGLDGPVVRAARQALATKNVNIVLPWVQKQDETEIRKAFDGTLTVRALNPAAWELADGYLIQTLVRVHRAGEGAPYSGLKPAGRDLGRAIPAADKAVESGSLKAAQERLTHAVQHGLEQRFKVLQERKAHAGQNVEAGREYVRAYVEFLHFVERVHQATESSAPEHAPAQHEHE